ncbi:MAG: primosomal protein N' [Burkholderiaceae bacterium]|nr:primosomal protein N' [Burkholderiaceae bacterium]
MALPSPEACFARVVVDVPMAQPLDYRMSLSTGRPGNACLVPVGRRRHVGLIVDVVPGSEVEPGRLKDVLAVVAEVEPLNRHWLDFTQFAADYYQHPWGEVAIAALPPIMRSAPGPRFAQSIARIRKRVVTSAPATDTARRLTAEQHGAVGTLAGARGFGVFLLFGITGSGKTEVYLRAIEDRLRAAPMGQVLLLVPEINLTPQLEALLRLRFGDLGVVALHSGLADGERSAAWLAAHEGRARIVVGTRLAVFASLPSLALVVVDEEHDPSYKAGEGVRYSARDLAIKRAQMLGIPVVLGSATPSLESWAAAQAGRYQVLRLTQRATDDAAELPTVELVDLRAPEGKAASGIAAPVADALRATLERREQSLVFLNRRGYAPVVACDACGWLSRCPQCSAFSVFHKPDRTLRCHHCGFKDRVPAACPTCGNQALQGVGHGTQRIEERLRELMPTARVMRIDRDSTRRRHAAEQAFDAVHAGDVDVLVGTQMIAKGHDFQRVALVVVLSPDGQLASHDFRAPERLFSTLVQVAGRAGRGGHASRVLLQTRFPSHPLFAALARHDYAAFADAQLAERRAAGMPPYTHQALLTAEARTMEAALAFLGDARERAPEVESIRMFDPVPMALQKLAGVERAQLLVEADRRAPLQAFLRSWLAELRSRRARVRWQIEVDPQEI